ncbi:TPA: hypothetical protein KEY88_005213 [Serratia marcescens]|uniref:Uncharacterized protein n=2 Tax=Serratia TaxID=613 RepID=A0A9X8YQ21_SERMA|nr:MULTISPECIES: hypothetical protein [Serratia]MBS3894513.1 hypothetical protein [Serratia marcescens]TXE22525.1 hypothetical protein FOT63_25430 [Serratia ureilytica]HBC7422445.1 hypothetical protein [Serratia marcescens]
MPLSGTVAVGRSLEAKRMAAGQHTTGALLIMTGLSLAQGWQQLTPTLITGWAVSTIMAPLGKTRDVDKV